MIIGLMGYAQSGKDEVAKILVNKFEFERRAFADKIRDMLYDMNPMVGGEPVQMRVDADGWDKAKQHPEIRRLMQVLGVAARQHISESVWIAPALSNMSMTSRYVISDVRFSNEAYMIRALGGEIWRIDRPGVGPANKHISEKQLETISADRTLLNAGSLEDLDALVKLRLDSYLAYQTNQ